MDLSPIAIQEVQNGHVMASDAEALAASLRFLFYYRSQLSDETWASARQRLLDNCRQQQERLERFTRAVHQLPAKPSDPF